MLRPFARLLAPLALALVAACDPGAERAPLDEVDTSASGLSATSFDSQWKGCYYFVSDRFDGNVRIDRSVDPDGVHFAEATARIRDRATGASYRYFLGDALADVKSYEISLDGASTLSNNWRMNLKLWRSAVGPHGGYYQLDTSGVVTSRLAVELARTADFVCN